MRGIIRGLKADVGMRSAHGVAGLIVFCALLVSGCAGGSKFYDYSDAPGFVQEGGLDPRLAVTKVFGAPLSPLVRNMAVPSGRLRRASGLKQELLETLRPLDIVLVRSRPAVTRLAIPSHFTHATLWLGKPSEIEAAGLLDYPEVRDHRDDILAGKIVFEAAGSDVHLSGIRELTNTDEIVILRPKGLTRSRIRRKFRSLFGHLGMPFDYNFDYKDKSRLTCMETIAAVFPEFKLPVRYTVGRYAIIPDDLVRMALRRRAGVNVVRHIVSDDRKRHRIQSSEKLLTIIRSPSQRPNHAFF